MDRDDTIAVLRRVAERQDGLGLLLLHGSRGRDEGHPASDWDLGYLADARLDVEGLHLDLVSALGTELVDLVDLARATALLRFEASRSGRLVYEHPHGTHEAFVPLSLTAPVDRHVLAERAAGREDLSAVMPGLAAQEWTASAGTS